MGLLQGLGNFSNAVSGLLYPGMSAGAMGIDPRQAQLARAQAMMQMGAGLLGGQDFGKAYGLGQAAGYEPIEQARREALMRAEADWRKQQAERQARIDQQAIVDRNRERMYRRFDKQEEKERYEQDRKDRLERDRIQAGNMAEDNRRANQQFEIQRRAAERAEAADRAAAADRAREQGMLYGEVTGKGGRTGGLLNDPSLNPLTRYALASGQPAFIPKPKSSSWDGLPDGGAGPDPAAAIVTVRTPEEALALPSGTLFKTPDGRVKVRP